MARELQWAGIIVVFWLHLKACHSSGPVTAAEYKGEPEIKSKSECKLPLSLSAASPGVAAVVIISNTKVRGFTPFKLAKPKNLACLENCLF